jgi:hypothetical protein
MQHLAWSVAPGSLRQARKCGEPHTIGSACHAANVRSTGSPTHIAFCLLLLRALNREELASLNRSIQSTAKGIKAQLEGLSRDRAALPEPQQAKLRKLMQDFAAALQVRPCHCA